jgi:hypothetical protein
MAWHSTGALAAALCNLTPMQRKSPVSADICLFSSPHPCSLQNVFIAVNFEEESDTAEAEANDDDAMMRFEFLEGIVRAAFGKYISSK